MSQLTVDILTKHLNKASNNEGEVLTVSKAFDSILEAMEEYAEEKAKFDGLTKEPEIEYELHIGKVLNIQTNLFEPQQKIRITNGPLFIIETFANKTIQPDLSVEYNLNGCLFKVYPVIKAKQKFVDCNG